MPKQAVPHMECAQAAIKSVVDEATLKGIDGTQNYGIGANTCIQAQALLSYSSDPIKREKASSRR